MHALHPHYPLHLCTCEAQEVTIKGVIDSPMLSTTVGHTLRELLTGEMHIDSPAYQLAVWRMRSLPRVSP